MSLGGGKPRDAADSCIISRAWRCDCAHARGLRTDGGATSDEVDANMDPPHCEDALLRNALTRDSHQADKVVGSARGH